MYPRTCWKLVASLKPCEHVWQDKLAIAFFLLIQTADTGKLLTVVMGSCLCLSIVPWQGICVNIFDNMITFLYSNSCLFTLSLISSSFLFLYLPPQISLSSSSARGHSKLSHSQIWPKKKVPSWIEKGEITKWYPSSITACHAHLDDMQHVATGWVWLVCMHDQMLLTSFTSHMHCPQTHLPWPEHISPLAPTLLQ